MIEKNGMSVLFIIIIITATIIFWMLSGWGRKDFFAEMAKDFYICRRKKCCELWQGTRNTTFL